MELLIFEISPVIALSSRGNGRPPESGDPVELSIPRDIAFDEKPFSFGINAILLAS